MKKILFICVLVLVTIQACKNKGGEEKTEEKKENVSGSEKLAVYADSITIVADQLEALYDTVVSEVARNPARQEDVKVRYKDQLASLEGRMAGLTQNIELLLQNKEITDDEYQSVVLELDLSGVAEGNKKLQLLEIKTEENK